MMIRRIFSFVGVSAFSLEMLVLLSNVAWAQCPAGEILVDEDEHHWYCKTQHKYAQCIGQAGQDTRTQIRQECGRVFTDCINKWQNGLIVTIETGSCLALSLIGCGAGAWACASVCGAQVIAVGSTVVLYCHANDATTCFEKALADDRQRKLFCKRGNY
jgi:hypothetical protein